MAATIARAIGRGKNIEREGTRLGTESSEAQANTFKTFTTCNVNADGSGSVQVERLIGGRRERVGKIDFGPEDQHAAVYFYGVMAFTPSLMDGVQAADREEDMP